jgi:hypothetical protein
MSESTLELDCVGSHHNYRDHNNKELAQTHLVRYYDYSESPILFQICQSCFWCASSFSKLKVFNNCPACNEEGTIESMSIAPDETYIYDYNYKSGVMLSFKNKRVEK